MKKIPLTTPAIPRRQVETEETPANSHWETPTYDVYWRMPDGTTEHIGTTNDADEAEAFASELEKLENLRPL